MDACLDENVEFRARLERAGAVWTRLLLLPGLPHGFQTFCGFSTACQRGVDQTVTAIADLLAASTKTKPY